MCVTESSRDDLIVFLSLASLLGAGEIIKKKRGFSPEGGKIKLTILNLFRVEKLFIFNFRSFPSLDEIFFALQLLFVYAHRTFIIK